MSSHPAAPTDEPSSHLSNRLSRSPDEDPGTARQAHNGSRGLVATAPRSLSSLPTEILQNIFTQLYQSLGHRRIFAAKGRRASLRYIMLDKRILRAAKPIWMSGFTLPTDPMEEDARPVQDPLLAELIARPACTALVKDALFRLQENPFHLACVALATFPRLTSLAIEFSPDNTSCDCAPVFAALRNLPTLRSLSLVMRLVDNVESDLRLDRDLPLLRSLTIRNEDLIKALAPGFASLWKLSIWHFAMGRNCIPWRTLRYLEVSPEREAFEVAEFIESLTAYACEPTNPPLPLEELVLSFPALRQADQVELGEQEFHQADLYHIFRNLRPSSLRSLSLIEADSFTWTQPSFLLPSVTSLSLDGYCDLTSMQEFDQFLAFLEGFPSLQRLQLVQYRIFREATSDPIPTALTAATIACLSSRQFISLGPNLAALLLHLQRTKVTDVRYRSFVTDGAEMRWQREPGGAFKGERWTLS